MSYSRRQLYAMGEPLGAGATRQKPAGGYVCGGGGDSSSSSSNTQQTTTTNIDKRQVLGDSSLGITSDSSTVNVTTLDAGIVKNALDTVKAADATNGEGFTKLLSLAENLFNGAGKVIEKTQDTALGQIAALNTAANDSKGAIDQKTIIVIACAAAAALAYRKG